MKDDEELLGRVRDHVRTAQVDDVTLETFARAEREPDPAALEGELSEAERVALAAATAPLGDAFEEAVAARLSPRVAKPAAVPKVSILRRLSPYAMPLALAAGVVLYAATRGGGDGPEGPALPEYAILAHGEQAVRGPTAAPATSIELRIGEGGTPFEIVLRPAVAAEGRVSAWAFTVTEPGVDPAPLSAAVEVSREGSVRLRGTASSLGQAREVRVVLSPAGTLKFDDAVTRARAGASDAHVRVVKVPVERAARQVSPTP